MPVLYGAITDVYYSDTDNCIMIKVSHGDGTTKQYKCHNSVSVNNRMYSDKQEYLDNIHIGAFAKFGLNDGLAEIIMFDTNCLMHYNSAEFNNNEIKVDLRVDNRNNYGNSIIIALYRGSKLIASTIKPLASQITHTFENIPEVNEYYKVKAFYWSALKTMTPVSRCAEIPVLGK